MGCHEFEKGETRSLRHEQINMKSFLTTLLVVAHIHKRSKSGWLKKLVGEGGQKRLREKEFLMKLTTGSYLFEQ